MSRPVTIHGVPVEHGDTVEVRMHAHEPWTKRAFDRQEIIEQVKRFYMLTKIPGTGAETYPGPFFENDIRVSDTLDSFVRKVARP